MRVLTAKQLARQNHAVVRCAKLGVVLGESIKSRVKSFGRNVAAVVVRAGAARW